MPSNFRSLSNGVNDLPRLLGISDYVHLGHCGFYGIGQLINGAGPHSEDNEIHAADLLILAITRQHHPIVEDLLDLSWVR